MNFRQIGYTFIVVSNVLYLSLLYAIVLCVHYHTSPDIVHF